MGDQERSDLDKDFTMILCGANFLFDKIWSSYSEIILE